MGYFNYNGKLYKDGEPVITPDSRGLRYGDGLFETIKVMAGKLVFESSHFSRLWNGLQVLGFELPAQFTKELLQGKILELVSKNGVAQAARVRLSIIRSAGGLYDPKDHQPNYIIQCWPLLPNTGEWNSNGLVAGICTSVNKSCDILANLKHNNYLPYIIAAAEAKKNKWNDAIVLNSYGRVADTTIANVFTIKNGIVNTPPLTEGCVAGVLRIKLIQHLLENGFQVTEQPVTTAALLIADEVFFTNSIQQIRWVRSVNDKAYSNTFTLKIFASFIPTIS